MNFVPFCGKNVVIRWTGYVGVKFIWITRIEIKKYWYNTTVSFSKNIGNDVLNPK